MTRLLTALLLLAFGTSLYANYKKELVELRDSKQFDLMHQKLQSLSGKDDPWLLQFQGEAYEYGDGIAKDPEKALLFYKKAAAKDYTFSTLKLAHCYLTGNLVERDFRKAYWRFYGATDARNSSHAGIAAYYMAEMYLRGDYVDRNPIVANYWFEQAAGHGHKKAKKYLQQNPLSASKAKAYREGRLQSVKQSPAQKRIIGLQMGEDLPDDLKFPVEKAYENYSHYDSSNHSFHQHIAKLPPHYAGRNDALIYENPVKPGERLAWVQAWTTPNSDTLYTLQINYRFADHGQCKAFARDHMKSATDRHTVTDNRVAYTYVDFGVAASPTLEKRPDTISKVEKLEGLRHIVACDEDGSGTEGSLTLIDFDSTALGIVEAMENSRFISSYFGEEGQALKPYMKPFGIALTYPLSEDLSINSEDPFDKRWKGYDVWPRQSSSTFNKYQVFTSRITDTVERIWAEGTFKDKRMCLIGLNEIMEKLSDGFNGSEPPEWHKVGFGGSSSWFAANYSISRDGVTKSPEAGKEVVDVEAGCQEKGDGTWRGWLQLQSDYAAMIGTMENCLLDQRDCELWQEHIAQTFYLED